MRATVLIGAAAVGVAIVARRFARGCANVDFERRVERMPTRSPRRWMVENIRAIRNDTGRILDLLERERADAPGQSARTAS